MSNVRSSWEDRSAEYGEQLTGVLFRGLSDSANQAIDRWHGWLISSMLAPELPSHARVLDLGCGYGRNSKVLLKARGDTQPIGMDISSNYCRMYQAAVGDCVCGDMESTPFPSAHFDGVMAVTSLMYAGARAATVLAEIHRITKPGGWVLFVDPGDEIHRLIAGLRGRKVSTPTGGKGFSRDGYAALFTGAGFEVQRKGGNSWLSALLLVPGLARLERPWMKSLLASTRDRDCRASGYSAHALHRWVLARRR